jgi:hypothetical protein
VATLPDDPFDSILSGYDEHLSNARGHVPASRSQFVLYARRFLSWLHDHHGEKPLDRVNGIDILEFIADEGLALLVRFDFYVEQSGPEAFVYTHLRAQLHINRYST